MSHFHEDSAFCIKDGFLELSNMHHHRTAPVRILRTGKHAYLHPLLSEWRPLRRGCGSVTREQLYSGHVGPTMPHLPAAPSAADEQCLLDLRPPRGPR
jgi:hypothetical protein